MADQTVGVANPTVQIISLLLPIVLQFGLPLIEQVVNSIKQDPTIPQDIVQQTLLARLNAASQANQTVLNEQA